MGRTLKAASSKENIFSWPPAMSFWILELSVNSGNALVAQLAEHILGKDEVTGSIPVKGLVLIQINKESFDGKG